MKNERLAKHIARQIFERSAFAGPYDVHRIAFRGWAARPEDERDYGGLNEAALAKCIADALDSAPDMKSVRQER